MLSRPTLAALALALGSAVGCGSQSAPTRSGSGGASGGGQANPGSAGTSAGAGPLGGSATSGGAAGAGMGGGASGAGSAGDSGAGQGPPFGHPDPNASYPTYDRFTLWVVEEFNQPLDLDQDPIWTWSDGGFQTHRFRREAITFESGQMVLTLSETPQTGGCSYSNTGIVPDRTRTSGELRSRHNWFRYGRYEASLKAPSVRPGNTTVDGNYISSLFTYRHPACQEWREIDLEVTGDAAGHLVTNLITSNNDCTFTADKEQPAFFDLPGRSFRSDFQTIGFEWLPGSITFYYLGDGGAPVPLREITGPSVPELSAKLMANLWVFDDTFAFGGPEGDNNVYPLRAEYDFIRFYRWNGDSEYPCADMSAACLKPEDRDLSGNNACDGVGFNGDIASCGQCGTTQRTVCNAACE